ncbi:MAG: hypothetical protein ABL967_09020 [Bryobacteraceae bacterium]
MGIHASGDRNPELLGNFTPTLAVATKLDNFIPAKYPFGAAQRLTIGARGTHAGRGALPDQLQFESGHTRKNVQKKPTRWIVLICVQALSGGDEAYTVAVQGGELLIEMEDASAKSVELLNHHYVEPPDFLHQLVEGWTAGLRSRIAGVYEFLAGPTAALRIVAQLSKLNFAILIAGGCAGV